MRPRARHRTAALFALAIAAAACSGAGGAVDAPSVPPPGDRSTGSTATGNGPAAEILRFSAPRLDGGTIEGEDYSRRDVAFWFWAPW